MEAVRLEVINSSRYYPDLDGTIRGGWLGDAIEIIDERGVEHVERLRTDVFAGSSHNPLQHLGEAQTCHLLQVETEWRGSSWVSDDQEALRYGRRQGFLVFETMDVMSHVVAEGDLTGDQAFALMQQMADADRGVRMPASASELTR